MIGNRLIYGQQNLSNQTNHLNIYNDESQYPYSGLTIGKDNQDNLRLSYNTRESKGQLSVNNFSIESQNVSIPNILPSGLSNEQFKNLVIDSAGNLAIGTSVQFSGDLNKTIESIKSNISNIDKSIIQIQNRVEAKNDITIDNIEMFWIYGLCIFLFLLIVFVIYQIIHNYNQHHIILSMKNELYKFKITPDEITPEEITPKDRIIFSDISNIDTSKKIILY